MNKNHTEAYKNVLRYLKMLHIVWSQVRRRVTRRLTWLQTMCDILNRVSPGSKLCATFFNTWWTWRHTCYDDIHTHVLLMQLELNKDMFSSVQFCNFNQTELGPKRTITGNYINFITFTNWYRRFSKSYLVLNFLGITSYGS